jgi:hypothetical protein
MHVVSAGVQGGIEVLLGGQGCLQQQVSEVVKLLESMKAAQGSKQAAGPAKTAYEMVTLARAWELNPKEVKFDKAEDARGDVTKVELGSGGFGRVHRGEWDSPSEKQA